MSENLTKEQKLHQCFFKFIGYLNSLAEDKDKPREASKRNTRAILARFRESLRAKSSIELLKYVQYYLDELPEELSFYKKEKIEENYLLIARLFGLHPKSSRNLEDKYSNLGKSLAEYEREVNKNKPKSKDDETVSGTEKRFMALLKAREEDLADYLQQTVQLLGSKDISINWLQLLKDINNWGNENVNVRRSWARGFWGNTSTNTENTEKGEQK
jgi:CRISPR type I-E-associated protein CasB/Cse2